MPEASAPAERSGGQLSSIEYGRRADEFSRKLMPDSDPTSLNLGLRLVRASGAFVRAAEKEVQRPLNLNWSSFSTLFTLGVFESLEARTVARFTGMTRQAISLVLGNLDKAGLVERTGNDPHDGRLVRIRFSNKGRELTKEGVRRQFEFSNKWFAVLDDAERTELNRLLEKLLELGPRQADPRA